MAQNECQQMAKTEFYGSLRSIILTVYNSMALLEKADEFLESLDAATATAMTVPSDVQTVLSHLRTAIGESLAFYDGSATTQTRVLKDQINKLRYIK